MHSNNSNNSNKNNNSNGNNNSLKGTGTNNNNDSNSNKNTDNGNNSLKGTGTNNNNNSLKGTGTNNSLKGTGTNNNSKRVLRFEFSNATIESVMGFTTVHQYDDRKTYKEAWAQWLAHDEIAAMLKSEVERLTNLGYKGDVADKLFKSGRYYFRGATSAPRTPNDANGARRGQGMSRQGTSRAEPLCAEPLCAGPKALNALNQGSLHADPKPLGVRGALVAPRKYVTMGRELLRAMDDHIERGLRTNDAYTPAIGFSDFFRTYASSDLLKAEVGNLIRHYETVPNPAKKLHAKLKKTYKNRYFMMAQCNQ
jgi:hypothetical protein